MNIIRLPLQRQRNRALVCFVDLQVEYVSPGRALAVEQTEPWTSNCRRLLGFARQLRLPIAHFRQLRRDTFLNPATPFAAWIEEFRPRPSEMVFERALPSCYSAAGFAAVTDNIDHPLLLIAGLMSSGACLATALDGFHRGHSALFVHDASWSPPIGETSAERANAFSAELIGQFCEVMSTDSLMEWLSRESIGIAS